MTYDNWKSTEPETPEQCEFCYEPATHNFQDLDRKIRLCNECYEHEMERGVDEEPDYDAPTAREEQIRMYEMKYYGKGL